MAVKAYGERIREKRAMEGVGTRELARLVGISPSYLCDIEKGRRLPSLSVRFNIRTIFGIGYDVSESFTGEQWGWIESHTARAVNEVLDEVFKGLLDRAEVMSQGGYQIACVFADDIDSMREDFRTRYGKGGE